MVTNPGYINHNEWKKEKGKIKSDKIPFCEKCDTDRPFKSHHCSTCQTCILKMDHHCPWIANCVGFGNQKFFYQFLFYAALGDLIGSICLLNRIIDPNFSSLLSKPSRKINLSNNLFLEVFCVLKDPLLIIIGFGLCLAMAIAIGFLFMYQTYLILNDSSSIDAKKSHYNHNMKKIGEEIKNQDEQKCQNDNNNQSNINQNIYENKNEEKDNLIKASSIQKGDFKVKKENKSGNDKKEKKCDKGNCKSNNNEIGFFQDLRNTFRKQNIKRMQIILGDSFFEWFIPVFNPNDLNNGYNYLESD